jgi:serine-type D-Ala-D-Ala carboxypeptidase (penicillin-binding protein 5/6)
MRNLGAIAGAGLALALFLWAPAMAQSPAAVPAGGASAGPEIAPADAIDTEANFAFVEDVNTGAVLLAKDPDARLYPASMNKMMTAYVVFGMLKDGRAKLSNTLPVSKRAWQTGGSRMFLPLGAEVAIDDLLRGMIVESGNDAAVALAQGLGGSEAGFVKLMNETAKKIGLKGSHFADVTGLPNPDDWMTARDLATVAIRTIKDFPNYYRYYGEKSFTFDKIRQGNRNPLLYRNIGADGLKTGYTKVSGYSLTVSAVEAGRRIVMVLSGLPTKKARAEESERVIRWAFRAFADYRLFAKGARVDEGAVWLGRAARVPLTVARNLVVTLPRSARGGMRVTLSYTSPLPAPIRKGEAVGKITVSAPGVKPVEAPLVAGASVAPMGRLARIATLAGYLVWGQGH